MHILAGKHVVFADEILNVLTAQRVELGKGEILRKRSDLSFDSVQSNVPDGLEILGCLDGHRHISIILNDLKISLCVMKRKYLIEATTVPTLEYIRIGFEKSEYITVQMIYREVISLKEEYKSQLQVEVPGLSA